jgi:hypothetical protein
MVKIGTIITILMFHMHYFIAMFMFVIDLPSINSQTCFCNNCVSAYKIYGDLLFWTWNQLYVGSIICT